MFKESKITLTVLGGGQEIGANCYLLTWGGKRILLDCGLDVTKIGVGAMPAFDWLGKEQIDAAIVSHAHIDHVGGLPVLMNRYLSDSAQIFLTIPTEDLTRVMLADSAKMHESLSGVGASICYFDTAMDRETLSGLLSREDLFSPQEYYRSFELFPGLTASFFQAGHILGAAGIVLTDGRYTLVYTGDIAKNAQTTISGCCLPRLKHTDCLLIESTRGSIEVPSGQTRSSESVRLAEEINSTISRGGHVLMPSFALGKSQELLIMLALMKKGGLIPADVPVLYQHGLTSKINAIYSESVHYLQGIDPNIMVYCSKRINGFDEKGGFRSASKLTNQPSIFVFTSGMVSHGSPSAHLATELIQDEINSILFTGYIDPNEFGYQLATSPTHSLISAGSDSVQIHVRCPHRYRFALSSHSDRGDLLDIADHFDPDTAIWVHGDQVSTSWLTEYFSAAHPQSDCLAPSNLTTITLRHG